MDAADHRILTKTATASQPQQRMVSSPKVTDTPLHPSTSKSTRPDPPCPLAELVQYDCRIAVQRLPEGNVGECIVCEEVPRIFRLCPGRPSVEVTRTVKFDSQGRAYEPPRPSS